MDYRARWVACRSRDLKLNRDLAIRAGSKAPLHLITYANIYLDVARERGYAVY
ncbi:hypothetical protein JMJ77_0011696 [Colletotrichum scovillei]|uniref:Uncharacterized protein n=1 Tax=Colletotrichum scovillei TaxID=1209932 RepID=A0A9P7QWE1_9PEZI|nr:hypothetical protein JMJ77_0011696 [Colletotrichum scovillei]KAG7045975.1 hypothetical protein JMJ78_0011046 [Colletotrichum scovillei]KAG7063323.1 hypothetical protein JMJ76_0005791 [Colletotrichum scovillei]